MRKILVVDDHQLIFDGLATALKGQFNLESAPTTDQACEYIERFDFYAVIIDISIGKQKGFDIVCEIPKSTYVFFLSMHKSAMYIQMAKDFNAKGYFLKDESLEILYKALRSPLQNDFWMSSIVKKELEQIGNFKSANYDRLSPREQQIFSMLAEDLSYKEIAGRLKLSTKTVNNHRANLMKKLGIDTQIGLVHEAVRLGIISIE